MRIEHLSVKRALGWAFAVALAAIAGVLALQQWARQAQAAEMLLLGLRGELHAISALEWEAVAEREVEEKIEEEIVEHKAVVARLSAQLVANPGAADVTALLAMFDQYLALAHRQFGHIRRDELEAAFALDKAEVDPMFERLHDELDAQAEANRVLADQVARAASAGIVLSLLGAALAIGLVFARFSQAQVRQTSELKGALDDLQRAQDQLVQSEKLAALGQLIAGVAHEINTPLGAIRAAAGNHAHALSAVLQALPKLPEQLEPEERQRFFALVDSGVQAPALDTGERRALRRTLTERLQAEGVDSPRAAADVLIDIGAHAQLDAALPLMLQGPRRPLLDLAYDMSRLQGNNRTILEAVERAAKVVFALKSYVRVDDGAVAQPVVLSQSLQTVLDLYASQLRQGIELHCDFADVPVVQGHPDELIQVWTNLVHNAVQAMGGRGRLTLRTGRGADGAAVVEVVDSGPGIPADVLPRIFDAFFTTKPRGEGSGLGLHICRKIVQRHGGTLLAQSRPGQTVFSVTLPALTQAPAPVANTASASVAAPRAEEALS